MTSKKFTQPGTLSVAVLLPVLIFSIVMLLITGFDEIAPALILIFVIATFFVCLLIFYKLTIDIDDTHLSFSLGTGLIKKKYALRDIESCVPVKNSAIYGVGIRLIPGGWLYNVSGQYAVELTFKNKKSKIRIGTDKPEEVAETVNKLLNIRGSGLGYDNALETSGRSGFFLLVALIAAGLILPLILVISGGRDTEVEFSGSAFTIKGMYGMTVENSNIISLDTIVVLPGIKARTNRYAMGNTLKGNFRLQDQTKVKLFVENGIPPYILIKTSDDVIYLNFSDPAKTKEVFRHIISNK